MVVVLGGAFLTMKPRRITQEKFDRIQEGMTRDHVTAILGEPSQATGLIEKALSAMLMLHEPEVLKWVDGPDVVTVAMYARKVRDKAYKPPTFLERLRWLTKIDTL